MIVRSRRPARGESGETDAPHRTRRHGEARLRRRIGIGSPVVWGALAIITGAAFGYCLWMSPTVTTTVTRPFTVTYGFDYRASEVGDDGVYGPSGLRFGDPVFLSLVDRLTVDITFDPRSPDAVVGDGDLEVVGWLSSSAGWTTEMLEPVIGSTSGGLTRATAVIDFAAITVEIERLDELTRTTGSYSLVLTAHGSTTAVVDPPGVALVDDRSSASIEFAVSATTASLVSPEAAAVPGRGPGGDDGGRNGGGDGDREGGSDGGDGGAGIAGGSGQGDPSVVEVTRMVSAESTELRSIPLVVTDLDVTTLRRLLGGMLLGLVGLTMVAMVTQWVRHRRRSDAERLLDRHHRHVFPLAGWSDDLERHAVEVADFGTLEAISASTQLPILYASVGPGPTAIPPEDAVAGDITTRFVVVDGPTAFVLRAVGDVGYRPRYRGRDRRRHRRRPIDDATRSAAASS